MVTWPAGISAWEGTKQGVEPMAHPGYHLVFGINAPTLGGYAASVGALWDWLLSGIYPL